MNLAEKRMNQVFRWRLVGIVDGGHDQCDIVGELHVLLRTREFRCGRENRGRPGEVVVVDVLRFLGRFERRGEGMRRWRRARLTVLLLVVVVVDLSLAQ